MLKLSRLLITCYKNRIHPKYISNTCILYCSKSKQMDTLQKFTPIYKFPYIRVLAIINRMKFYHASLSALAIPSSIICSFLDVTRPDAAIFVAALSLAGCLPLFGLGYLFEKFVGFIYYNPEDDIVRVAFIDSWGKRRDIELPRKDIVPLNELPVTMTDGLFIQFTRFSTTDKMKLNLKFGEILNKELFNKVFQEY